jgi:hypothetical protein
MGHMSFLFRNHLHKAFLHDDLLRCGSMGCRNRGCGNISSVVANLILPDIFSHAVKFSLLGDLLNQLIARLDHSFKGGLFFLLLLSIFSQPLAQGLQLRDLLD